MLTSKYFKTQELVDKETYNLLGENAIKLIDTDLIKTIDAIREILNVPLICNNWHKNGTRQNCGFRTQKCKIGAKNSYHKNGQAVDLISYKMTAKEMREILEQNKEKLPLPIRIEKENNNGEIDWLHVDMGNETNDKIKFFKA